jgi:photosystem II stability/assembly factor-like uncharacterized protein
MKNLLHLKKVYLLVTFIVFMNGYSQYNESAPWFQNQKKADGENKELTLKEIKSLFDEYWKTHDKNKRASGYKPFMRWYNRMEDMVDEKGYVVNSSYLINALNEKKLAKQKNELTHSKALPSSDWKPLGPNKLINTGSWAPGLGRLNTIHVDPSNASTIYVGAAAGGIWKSSNSGASWTQLDDPNSPETGVSGIAVDYSNSNTIYIATGDRDGGDSSFIGVLKSTDGGKTWKKTGLTSSLASKAGDLIIHPTNNQVLLCATNKGIFKTTDGGTNWKNVQSGSFSSGTIKLKTNDPQTVFAVSNSNFYRSTNGGDTFSNTTTGFPTTSGRIMINVTPKNANYIYAIAVNSDASFNGLYKSTNGGDSWIKTGAKADILKNIKQAFYDLGITVSPTNTEEIYLGTTELFKSTDGGENFKLISLWNQPSKPGYMHPDIHFLDFFGNKLFCGNDGGIYTSTDGGTSYTDISSGLHIGMFYRIAASKESSTKLNGGLQDNGGFAFSNSTWKNYYGADGMDVVIDPTNSNKYYGFIQNGLGLYSSNDAGNSLSNDVNKPTGENDGNWITPLAINSKGEVFSGFSKLYILKGSAWVAQSSSTIGTGNIDKIEIDPSNNNIIYVSNEKDLYKSTDKGINFVKTYTNANKISSICVNSSDNNIVYLTTSGSNGDVLKSTNGGTDFTSIVNGLPTINKNVIKHQGLNKLNPLYLATGLGVYYRDDSMTKWEAFDKNLPEINITDIEINTTDNIITAATYGRGVWQSAINLNSLSNNDYELQNIAIKPNPSNGIFNISTGDTPINDITINDVSGKRLKSYNNFIDVNSNSILDLSALANGIYLVKFSYENKAVVKKIIKN